MKKIVQIITKRCLGIKKGETFLIVCDDNKKGLAHDFHREALSLGIKSTVMQMAPRKMHGEEPPKKIAKAMKNANVAILLTTMSLSHTKARKEACKKSGTRIASLPGITKQMLERSIPIDYSALHKKATRLARLLSKANTVRILTKEGTDLTMSVKGRKGFADDGLYTRRGAFGNLPAGEACLAPREGTTNGSLVVDASAPFIGKIKRHLKIIIKNGYAQNIPFSKMAPLIRSYGKAALNVAELGIGLNPKARVTGNTLEDEKAKNTAHIALGNNKSFGGTVSCPCHLDFVILGPVILIDGVKIK